MKERRFLLLNLVAERRRRARLLERRGRQMIWASALLLAVLILYLLYSSIKILTLQGDLQELAVKAEDFAPVLRRAETLQNEINSLTPRLQYIQDLRENIFLWQGLSLEIQRILSSDAWLDSLSFSPAQKGVLQITLSGKALSYKSVGDYILKLQGTGHYQAVDLKSASLGKVGDRDIVQFQLELQTSLPEGETR